MDTKPRPALTSIDGRVLEHADRPDDAVAAAVMAGAAGAAGELVALDPHGVLQFKRLDRRVQGVGHPDVHPGGAVAATRRALATADRLVVGPSPPADHGVDRGASDSGP